MATEGGRDDENNRNNTNGWHVTTTKHVEVTTEGIIIDDYNLLPWDWIDKAREEVNK